MYHPPYTLLYIDPRSSRQSEISMNRTHLCEYDEVVTWMIGNRNRYEMIYADAYVRA